jgi:hypothetical protein
MNILDGAFDYFPPLGLNEEILSYILITKMLLFIMKRLIYFAQVLA